MGVFSRDSSRPKAKAKPPVQPLELLCSKCESSRALAPSEGLRAFPFEELARATENFCFQNFLGGVYRGVLLRGKQVAIVTDQVRPDIQLLEKLSSPYLVTLLGYCERGEHTKRLLVYDFVCNGFLRWHLSSFVVMPWKTRKKIATRVARALKYLHIGTGFGAILHRNLSSRNVLLTHDFDPLIGGLSYIELMDSQNSGCKPPLKPGYTAPECLNGEPFTEKSDMYSLGVIFLELITGKQACDSCKLVEWARPLMKNFDIQRLVDPRIADRYNHCELFSLMNAASFCLKRDPSSRPSILMVLTMLDDEEFDVLPKFSFSSTEMSDFSVATTAHARARESPSQSAAAAAHSPSSGAQNAPPVNSFRSSRTVGLSYGEMLGAA